MRYLPFLPRESHRASYNKAQSTVLADRLASTVPASHALDGTGSYSFSSAVAGKGILYVEVRNLNILHWFLSFPRTPSPRLTKLWCSAGEELRRCTV